MKKLLIHPTGKSLKDSFISPKNYPYFNQITDELKNKYEINQLGITGDIKLENITHYYFNQKLENIQYLIDEHDLWVSVDSFLPHYCNCYGLKSGIVIWSISDPEIFGYKQNINLIKDRKYIRHNKFDFYKKEDYNPDSHIEYQKVIEKIEELLND